MPPQIPASRIVGRQLRFSAMHIFHLGFGQALKFMVIEKIQRESFLINPAFWKRFTTVSKETHEWKEKFPRPGTLGALGLTHEVHLGNLPIFTWHRMGHVHKVGKYYVWYHFDHKFYMILDSDPKEMDLYILMENDHPLQLELLQMEEAGEGNYSLLQIDDEFARWIAKWSQVSPFTGPALAI